MRVLFMGTPAFALPSLDRIHRSKHEIIGVVTGADKPRGRGHQWMPTPVAQRADELGLVTLKVNSLKDDETVEKIRSLPCDVIVLVAFGHLIPPDLLHFPPKGCVNLHPSLLPAYRGASPIHAPLLAGDEVTGVSTMYMDEGLDTGDIILQEEIAIAPEANAGHLHDLLAEKGAELLVQTLDLIARGDAPRIPQDDERASYAPKVIKQSVNWDEPADNVVRKIKGLSPFPGVYSMWNNQPIKLLNGHAVEKADDGDPGTILQLAEQGPLISCSDGAIILTEVQPAGRKPMKGSDFVNGFRLTVGQRLT